MGRSSSAAARQDLSGALQDALAQVEALKAELDKVRRENESLCAQLASKSEPDRYMTIGDICDSEVFVIGVFV